MRNGTPHRSEPSRGDVADAYVVLQGTLYLAVGYSGLFSHVAETGQKTAVRTELLPKVGMRNRSSLLGVPRLGYTHCHEHDPLARCHSSGRRLAAETRVRPARVAGQPSFCNGTT